MCQKRLDREVADKLEAKRNAAWELEVCIWVQGMLYLFIQFISMTKMLTATYNKKQVYWVVH